MYGGLLALRVVARKYEFKTDVSAVQHNIVPGRQLWWWPCCVLQCADACSTSPTQLAAVC